MTAFWKYVRLAGSLARYALAREMAFRSNFVVKVAVEALWLGMMLAFYQVVFAKTGSIAGWSKAEYLFFVGCFFAINGVIEAVFLDNFNEFAELVRTGDLDFLLLRPIDEQFLISFRRIDWGCVPNIVMGGGVMLAAIRTTGLPPAPERVLAFGAMFVCGVAIAYSFMVVFAATSVWLVRNQSLMEIWWMFSSLARYPREIFNGGWAEPIGRFFTYAAPILLVVNVPARTMVKALDPPLIAFTVVVTAVALALSRRFFRLALRSYRSASS